MNKIKLPLFFTTLFLATTISCGKYNSSADKGERQNNSFNASSLKIVTSDSYLISIIRNGELDQYEKAKILLDEDLLSTTVCQELLSASTKFDPYIIEVALASQTELEDQTIIQLIGNKNINNSTVKSILQSKSPLSSNIKSKLSSTRPEIGISEITQYDNYIKLINMCDQSIIYTESLVYSKGSQSSNFLLKNSISKNFANSVNPIDLAKMTSGCGGRWTCGHATVTDKGDGLTSIQCLNTSEKCVKIAKQNKTFTTYENTLITTLDNSSLTSFEKANPILNTETISAELMNEIIDRRTYLNPYAFEIIILSSGRISDPNLAKLIIDQSFEESTLRNIMIVNAPLSDYIKQLTSKFRPSITLNNIAKYNDKSIAISMCIGGILCGDEILLEEINSTNHKVSIKNQTIIPFVNSAPNSDVATMIAGCGGKWVCGDYVYEETFSTTVTHYCSAPPNKKCMKVSVTKK